MEVTKIANGFQGYKDKIIRVIYIVPKYLSSKMFAQQVNELLGGKLVYLSKVIDAFTSVMESLLHASNVPRKVLDLEPRAGNQILSWDEGVTAEDLMQKYCGVGRCK